MATAGLRWRHSNASQLLVERTAVCSLIEGPLEGRLESSP